MVTIYDRKTYPLTGSDDLIGREGCPFCDLDSCGDNIVWRGESWYILHNMYPYSGTSDHLMAIPYAHKTYAHELTQDEVGELPEIFKFMKEHYGEKHYFSCTRETLANRSMEHHHIHFIPGKLQGKFLRKMLELQGFPITENLEFPGK